MKSYNSLDNFKSDFKTIVTIGTFDGVHIGQDDMDIDQARAITPDGFIIGTSCQSLDQALKAEQQGVDYIGFGSVFKTILIKCSN